MKFISKESINILTLALIAYSFATITGLVYHYQILGINSISHTLPQTQQDKTSFGIWYIVFLIASVVGFYFLFKHLKKQITSYYKFLSYYMVFIVSFTSFYISVIWLSLIIMDGNIVMVLSLLIAFAVYLLYHFRRYKYFNLFGFIVAIGVPVILGQSITTTIAIAILIIMSIYDFIAVFITKHMQEMAATALGKGNDKALPLLFVIGNIDSLKARFEGKQQDQENVKKTRTAGLGLGDIILPALIPITLIISSPANLTWLYAIFGGIFGLMANMVILVYYKKPLPALPLICIGMLLSFII